jgi:hypothetical protein
MPGKTNRRTFLKTTGVAVAVEPNVLFGVEDGLLEMTVAKSNRSDNQGEIKISACVGEKEAIRARVNNLRYVPVDIRD